MSKDVCQTLVLILGLAGAGPALGQTYRLAETPRDGDCFRLTAQTDLTGTLKVTREGKPVSVRVAARNDHAFTEKVLATDKGRATRAVRHYGTAASRSTVDGERLERSLAVNHRLIVAQRTGDNLRCFSPAGPLTRSDLEMVSEHFETLDVAGLLPGKLVKVGDAWKLDSGVAQSVCLFEGLISHELTGTFKELAAGKAVITIAGTARGIENGALATLTVAATLQFDLATQRVVDIEWKQKDVREQGPVTPAAEVETATRVKREPLAGPPDELSAAALAGVPAGADLPSLAQYLLYRDPRGRFLFLHDRAWHQVGQTDFHLILRLLDRGDFVAQATLTVWKNAGPGKHMSPAEFEDLVSRGTGWKPEVVIDRSEVPTDNDRWVYRVIARGDLDGVQVVQNFYVLAGPTGDQMILTFTLKPESVEKLGTRDVALVNAIEFGKP